MGQNFLLDLNLTRKIARAAGPLDGATVVEIGPGPGGLTRSLLMEGAARVIAIERDARVLPALEDIAAHYPGRLEIIAADALAIDYGALAGGGPIRIAANLPYNIATPLLTGWLTADPWPPWYASATLMFQKEVAERITAAPGSKTFGRLSVLAQWRCRASRLFDISRHAFTPPPKVTSSVVRIDPLPRPDTTCPAATLERVTAAAFGQRRKMLRSSLKPLSGDTVGLLSAAGIEPTLRAEDLEVDDFCRLARCLAAAQT